MSTSEDHGTREWWLEGGDVHDLSGTAEHRPYDERGADLAAFLFAVLMGAAIIGLFMFITWLTYTAD